MGTARMKCWLHLHFPGFISLFVKYVSRPKMSASCLEGSKAHSVISSLHSSALRPFNADSPCDFFSLVCPKHVRNAMCARYWKGMMGKTPSVWGAGD